MAKQNYVGAGSSVIHYKDKKWRGGKGIVLPIERSFQLVLVEEIVEM